MKKRIHVITLSMVLLVCGICQASLYGPQGPMTYFTPYKGTWKVPLEDKDLKLTVTTVASFSHVYNVFTIYKSYQNGQIAFADSVTIASEPGRRCSAVLYMNQQSSYFYGTPDKKSKVFVMQTTHPKIKTPKYLIIDFSGCPKKPPTYRVSDEKPKANKSLHPTVNRFDARS